MGTYAPAPTRPSKFCTACSDIIDRMAVVCPRCGVMQPTTTDMVASEKRILPAFLLCFFLGVFGVATPERARQPVSQARVPLFDAENARIVSTWASVSGW